MDRERIYLLKRVKVLHEFVEKKFQGVKEDFKAHETLVLPNFRNISNVNIEIYIEGYLKVVEDLATKDEKTILKNRILELDKYIAN